MVLGQPVKFTLGKQVDPAVSNIEHCKVFALFVNKANYANGGPHASQPRVIGGTTANASVCLMHCSNEFEQRPVANHLRDHFHSLGRGNLSCLVATHTISNGQHIRRHKEVVFIGGSHLTNERGRTGPQAN
jgi:hypothetical protein